MYALTHNEREYHALCDLHIRGYKYIACSGDGNIWAYRYKPNRDTNTRSWEMDNRQRNVIQVLDYIEGISDKLTWNDEPIDIDELIPTMKRNIWGVKQLDRK